MAETPYIMLVTAEEYGQIQKFVGMGLDLETLSRAIGEIVGVPGCELALPLLYQIDERAPGLRFAEMEQPKPPPQAPPEPDASGDAEPVGPHPIHPLFDSARRVYLVAEI